mmetsp:Transcript_3085/g.6707  ORF Transcript_3085/g.6707 Transcript_3085/m.6707 type:complete len:82 (+) Transcript_3085:761-1006(+)
MSVDQYRDSIRYVAEEACPQYRQLYEGQQEYVSSPSAKCHRYFCLTMPDTYSRVICCLLGSDASAATKRTRKDDFWPAFGW